MTSKEFVKEKYPRAKAERHVTNGGRPYWLVRDGREDMYMSEGTSESNAWVNAKTNIKGE